MNAVAVRWVGIDEHGGVPSQARADLVPPEHWRLDAVAATERVRSLAVSPDGSRLAYVHDRDGSSDVWVTGLAPGDRPVRLTTTRAPMPYWEDTALAWSPDGSTIAFGDDGEVALVAAAGGPVRRLGPGWGPVWLDDSTLVAGIERDRRNLVVRLDRGDPWPVPVARHPAGDADGPVVSPDGGRVAYAVWRHDVEQCRELWVAPLVGDEPARCLAELPGLLDGQPAWSADGTRLAHVAQTGEWTDAFVLDLAAGSTRRLTETVGDLGSLAWHPSGTRLVGCRTLRGRSELVVVDASSGWVEVLAAGGSWSEPAWLGDRVVACFEDHRTPPRVEIVEPSGGRTVLLAPTPASVSAAPHVSPEEVSYRSADGRTVHGFLYRPAGAGTTAGGVPAVVHAHGGPASASGDEWDGVAQYFVAKGYAWFSVNFRGSTGYGREHERANHGDWGGGDVDDVLAAHGALAALGWVDPRRVAVYGPSYGSYLALGAVARDPDARFAAAICKYGDCDILTSWAQGDRTGVIEQERMLGRPHGPNRAVYERGSPYHHLDAVRVPVLVAHGELDQRVSPAQAAQHVARLRELGKRYEYVTYPTEAHGFLRREPFLHFWSRVERFLDWHLM